MKTQRMTIHEIKRRVEARGSHFFDRKTLRFFGQTMKSFSVRKLTATTWLISAPIIDKDRRFQGATVVMFDSTDDSLRAIN